MCWGIRNERQVLYLEGAHCLVGASLELDYYSPAVGKASAAYGMSLRTPRGYRSTAGNQRDRRTPGRS